MAFEIGVRGEDAVCGGVVACQLTQFSSTYDIKKDRERETYVHGIRTVTRQGCLYSYNQFSAFPLQLVEVHTDRKSNVFRAEACDCDHICGKFCNDMNLSDCEYRSDLDGGGE